MGFLSKGSSLISVMWGKNHALWSKQGLLGLQLATGTSTGDACSWHLTMWSSQDTGMAPSAPFFHVVQEGQPAFSVLWHPRGPPLVHGSSGCLGGVRAAKGGGAHHQRGAPGHAPRCVAELVALFAKDAKMAWPRENKYLHIRVHSQNYLLSFEL